MKPHPIIGEPEVGEEALDLMVERGGTWAAYQNVDLGSPDLGSLRFLQVGAGCTFAEPPERMPDSKIGTGWRLYWIGWVNLETGKIMEVQP